MKLTDKIALLQALLADEPAHAELLGSLAEFALSLGVTSGLPIHDSGYVEDMKEIVKDWLCKLVLRNEVRL